MLSRIRFASFVGKHGDDVRNGPPHLQPYPPTLRIYKIYNLYNSNDLMLVKMISRESILHFIKSEGLSYPPSHFMRTV